MYDNELDKLIYGKEKTERIVNIEIKDNKAIFFLRDKDSNLSTKEYSHKFWLLTPIPLNKSIQLQGNLYYKYGIQFSSKKDWENQLQQIRKKRIDFYTAYDAKESFMINKGTTYYKGMKHTEPVILSFDIEATGLFHDINSKVLLISNTYRKNGVIERKLFSYDEFINQGEMLKSWCKWIREKDPDIIVAHNGYSYDLPYLNFIADREGVKLNLGRDGSPLVIKKETSKFRVDGSREQEYHKCRVYGRELIDTYFLALRHDIVAKKYESYGLKAIIKAEGLEKTDREFYDASTIRFNYTDPVEWDKIKRYCIHDSDDALAVFDLTAPATFYLTQSIPKPFQNMVESATGAQINALMIRSYLQEGHSIPKPDPVKKFPGAISRGKPGIYKNCVRWDVASLYPSIILAYKVYDEDKDPKGNFLKIMEAFTNERLKNKKLAKETNDPYYEGLQNAQKIVINSGYGFFGAQGLHFNCLEAADFITARGREILATAIEWATNKPFNEWDQQFDE